MTTELLSPPITAALPEVAPASASSNGETGEDNWQNPIHNPRRSALVASACAKLLEASRRLELLNARVRELTEQAA